MNPPNGREVLWVFTLHTVTTSQEKFFLLGHLFKVCFPATKYLRVNRGTSSPPWLSQQQPTVANGSVVTPSWASLAIDWPGTFRKSQVVAVFGLICQINKCSCLILLCLTHWGVLKLPKLNKTVWHISQVICYQSTALLKEVINALNLIILLWRSPLVINLRFLLGWFVVATPRETDVVGWQRCCRRWQHLLI